MDQAVRLRMMLETCLFAQRGHALKRLQRHLVRENNRKSTGSLITDRGEMSGSLFRVRFPILPLNLDGGRGVIGIVVIVVLARLASLAVGLETKHNKMPGDMIYESMM